MPHADALPTVVGFGRALRAAGVAATTDRLMHMVTALDQLDPARRRDVYWAGRLTLCADPDDVERYDRAFDAYFAGMVPRLPAAPRALVTVAAPTGTAEPPGGGADDEQRAVARVAASAAEVLRHRDIDALTAAERVELNRLLAAFRLPGETRRTRRFQPARRGAIDRSRTVRELLRRGGEPARLRHHRHRRRPRRVVLLVDVSGSMAAYADALLRFAHAAARREHARTEVFTIGTRLTRVSVELAHRDPDLAMAAVAAAVPDWSGGTRLGEQLRAFLDRWGQRGMARGAVVVLLSDGWERGDPTLLGEQMQRLARHAWRVVWANPRKGHVGYEPLAGGMAAALPFVDDFVEGHTLAALERLARVVAGAAGGAGASTARRLVDA